MIRTTSGPAQKMIRLQCAICQMEFIRITPLAKYGRCPHCEKRTPFGNRWKRERQLLSALLFSLFLAIGLSLQLTKIFETHDNKNIFNILYISLYLSAAVSAIFFGYYSRIKVTYISESDVWSLVQKSLFLKFSLKKRCFFAPKIS